MLIYPAIDLKDGVCVRLMHGKFDQVTQYDEQPAARLTAFAAEGAQWIHIVDLDGAEAGQAVQHALIGELTQAIDVKVQSGGGVRSANDVAKLLDSGVARVVVGSLAVTQPNDVAAWLKGFGIERITLALDVKMEDGVPAPALKGWTQSSGVTLWEALDRYPKGTAKHLLVTDVGPRRRPDRAEPGAAGGNPQATSRLWCFRPRAACRPWMISAPSRRWVATAPSWAAHSTRAVSPCLKP